MTFVLFYIHISYDNEKSVLRQNEIAELVDDTFTDNLRLHFQVLFDQKLVLSRPT